jgi:cell division protein FtsA
VIDDEEKEVGVALIDIGAGTTDIAIFESNVLRFTSIIALGGRQVTDDVKKVLGIIGTQAEKIKKDYGHTYIDTISDDTLFQIPGIAGRKPKDIYKSQLCQIIQTRMEEILQFTLSEIRRSGFSSNLDAGVVLTGGCALLSGIEELAYDVFGMPVKIGYPSKSTYVGLVQEIGKTIYSTAVGLILYSIQKDINIDNMYQDNRNEEKIDKSLETDSKGITVMSKMMEFFKGL